MADRRPWIRVAMVAIVTLGSGSAAACGDDDRPRGADEPRDEEIRATIDGVWEAVGEATAVDPEVVTVAEYGYTFAPDNTDCRDLPREDRWFGERGSHVPAGQAPQDTIEDAILAHLEAEGFTLRRYRSTHPDSPLRAYRAVRDEVVVDGTTDGEGYASVNVRSGPCAPTFGAVDPDRFQPDP